MKLRMPAYPLITVDPYFSIWSFGDTLNGSNTVHWTGKENRIIGTVSVENENYCFMGTAKDAVAAEQISADCTALSTVYKFACGKAVLTAKFITPLLIDDLSILSKPVSFLEISVSGVESAVVTVKACEELCLDHAGQCGAVKAEFYLVVKMQITLIWVYAANTIQNQKSSKTQSVLA